MKRNLILLVVAIAGLQCRDSVQPTLPYGKYRVRFTVDGSSMMTSNTVDSIVCRFRDVSDTLFSTRAPWFRDIWMNSGDSARLSACDSYRDTWADSGDGFADYVRIEVFNDTSCVSCSAMYRSIPRYGGWMSTQLTVPTDSAIAVTLSRPEIFRPHCEK